MPAYMAIGHLTGKGVNTVFTYDGWRVDQRTLIASSYEEAVGATYEIASKLGPELAGDRNVVPVVLELSRERLLELLEHARPQSEIDAELTAKEAAVAATSE